MSVNVKSSDICTSFGIVRAIRNFVRVKREKKVFKTERKKSNTLVRVTITVIKHHDPKQVLKGRYYLSYISTTLSITEGRSQGRSSNMTETCRQELMLSS